MFLDIRKAFDSVDHTLLLQKIYRYGFRDNTFNLLSSFLNSRTQQVQIQSFFSDPLPITCGVPQGSVLGPLLFILMINDLPSVSEFFTVLFADDASLSLFESESSLVEKKSELPIDKSF